MKRLFWRIYLVVLLALAVFGGIAWWLVQRNMDQRKQAMQQAEQTYLQFVAEHAEERLPLTTGDKALLAKAFHRFARGFRRSLALTDAGNELVAMSRPTKRRKRLPQPMPLSEAWMTDSNMTSVPLSGDHRLWLLRPPKPPTGQRNWMERVEQRFTELTAFGLALFLGVLGVMSAVFVFPLVFQLSRRMDALKHSVSLFGAGQLSHRSNLKGQDELAELSGTFNRMASQIEGLIQEHKTLLATTSHELRSPLTRLRMAVGLWLDASDEVQKANLREEIERNIDELDGLIGDVLLSSQLNASNNEGDMQTFDVAEVLRGELSYYPEAACASSSMPISAPIWIRGDRHLVMRAFRNVLENARRYGGEQGEAVFETVRSEHMIDVSVAPVGNDLIDVAFADRGQGVPEAWRDQIFQPFFRLPEHKESQGGTGVGLMLVKQIADRHEGVRYEPREGGGSRFVLRFRLASGRSSAA